MTLEELTAAVEALQIEVEALRRELDGLKVIVTPVVDMHSPEPDTDRDRVIRTGMLAAQGLPDTRRR